MSTLYLINYISANPYFKTIVIMDLDDKTPIQAIEWLSTNQLFDEHEINWRINGTLEKETLIVYKD